MIGTARGSEPREPGAGTWLENLVKSLVRDSMERKVYFSGKLVEYRLNGLLTIHWRSLGGQPSYGRRAHQQDSILERRTRRVGLSQEYLLPVTSDSGSLGVVRSRSERSWSQRGIKLMGELDWGGIVVLLREGGSPSWQKGRGA